jgi:hypothetical protein
MPCWPGTLDLGTRVDRKGIAVRELWVHRIEEYARHCGHADLLRERIGIDGRVGQWQAQPGLREAPRAYQVIRMCALN